MTLDCLNLDNIIVNIRNSLIYAENKLYCGTHKKCEYKMVNPYTNTKYCLKLKDLKEEIYKVIQ